MRIRRYSMLRHVPGLVSVMNVPQAVALPFFEAIRGLMGLRNDPAKGLRGDAFTPDQRQDSGWLGLPSGAAYKEIFNSSVAPYQVEFESASTNGGIDAGIWSGHIPNLPYIGAVVLEQR